MTMPSSSGATNDWAQDRANTQASPARTPNAIPRASTAGRVVASAISTAPSADSATGAESGLAIVIGAAAEVKACTQTATQLCARQARCARSLGLLGAPLERILGQSHQQIGQLIGVLLLDGQNGFHHAARRRILLAKVVNDVAVAVYRDT